MISAATKQVAEAAAAQRTGYVQQHLAVYRGEVLKTACGASVKARDAESTLQRFPQSSDNL